MRKHWPIIGILGAAFVLRIAGIRYGLPMWLVGDEPSAVFGALKMLELKTLVPSLHQSAFAGTFYYGVVLPYAYLLPFLAAIGAKFLTFHGTFADLKNALVSDASVFFLIARVIAALIGTATVYIIYRAAQELFDDERAALASAAVLSFSLLHVDFSHWARHWAPVTFCFALVILALAQRNWSVGKRYVLASFITGIGVGISIQAGLAAVFIVLWFFFVDRLSILKSLRQRWFWMSIVSGAALVVLAFLLWTRSFDFLFASGSVGVPRVAKTLTGLLDEYAFHARNLLTVEPILFVFATIGAAVICKRRRGVAAALVGFIVAYLTIFYVFFTRYDRYILMLYPVFALLAGVGLARAIEYAASRERKLAHAVLIFPIMMCVTAAVFDVRLIRNDTRVNAGEWIAAHAGPGSKVAVLSPLMRLPTDAAAVAEQQAIDPKSVRSADFADRDLSSNAASPHPHVLNMSSMIAPDFFRDLPSYLQKNGYDYLVVTPEFLRQKGAPPETAELGESAAVFSGYAPSNRNGSLTEGFGDGLRELFSPLPMGPNILIRKLR